jgi:mRNA interferase RelE/StbE
MDAPIAVRYNLGVKTVRYTADAARALRRHANMAGRIRAKIAAYAAEPAAQANNVTRLVGVEAKRLRVGDFRVIFTETEDALVVLAIGPRGGIYD